MLVCPYLIGAVGGVGDGGVKGGGGCGACWLPLAATSLVQPAPISGG
jgi:hypothetical protein